MRVAVVTTAAPPSPNGQARVLGQVLATEAFASPIFLTDQMNILEPQEDRVGRYYALSAAQLHLTSQAWGKALRGFNRGGGLARTVWLRAQEIVSALRREEVDVVVGCSGNPFDLPAAWLAARRLKLPFVAYLFDDPVYQWALQSDRYLARMSERIWASGAAAIIVPNEILVEDIKKRLPRASIHIVRNPFYPLRVTHQDHQREPVRADAIWRLLYSGSVYHAQASAFRNLVAALDLLQGRFVLDIYTAQWSSDLVARELRSSLAFSHPNVPHAAIVRLQQSADVLFLPLAFDSSIPEVIRSSSPAKLGEYLAAGRPILVHAPAGTFVAELIRNADAGVVVDTPEPQRLVEALNSIARDSALRARIVRNASKLAGEFSIERAQAAFISILSHATRDFRMVGANLR